MKELFFTTSNNHKFTEAQEIISNYKVIKSDIDIQEIQGTINEISSHKTSEAYKKTQKPCFTEDTALIFASWGELPGPYIKSFLYSIGPGGLFKALKPFKNMQASAIATIGYMDSSLRKPLIFQGKIKGTIVSPRGESGFEWDKIFIPTNYEKTFAELGMEIKNKISHRKKALFKLQEYLS